MKGEGFSRGGSAKGGFGAVVVVFLQCCLVSCFGGGLGIARLVGRRIGWLIRPGRGMVLLRWSVGLGCGILMDDLADGGSALGPRFAIRSLCRVLENPSWLLRVLMTWSFNFPRYWNERCIRAWRGTIRGGWQERWCSVKKSINGCTDVYGQEVCIAIGRGWRLRENGMIRETQIKLPHPKKGKLALLTR